MADEKKAAFGVFPQMKPRRSRQDREAAKNVPVDLARGFVSGVLGAPGDIESLIRMLPGLDEQTVLPTSEDIEKRIPLRSDTPVSRAATGLGQLGGGFYVGPGSPLRAAAALPSAVKKAGQDFAMAAGSSGSRIFIGPKAKTWDQAAADAFERMEKAGVDPVEIWRQTGTFRGADGIPRQEISDVGAKFRGPKELKELGEAKKAEAAQLKERIKGVPGQKDMFPKALTEARKPAREQIAKLKEEADILSLDPEYQGQPAQFVLEHPELYKAYPELAGIKVTQGGYGGPSTKGSLSAIVHPEVGKHLEMDIFDLGLKGNPRSTMLHEMQHAVQTLEDMAPGGNTAMAFKDPRAFEILKKLREEIMSPPTFEEFQRANRYSPEEAPKAYEDFVKNYKFNVTPAIDRQLQERAAMEYYKRLAGEAEARATQFREPMGMTERRQEFPYSSYDVLAEDLIVKAPKQYAAGGKVRFSDNLDTMRLELAGGGAIRMDKGGAAFGVFPQMKGRRSKQDPEAAKNVPVDIARGFAAGALGMPGDVESLIRLLPGFDEETVLPTSKEILEKIPFGSDTPASRAAAELGILGGGAYTGPGSAARAITAVPKAIKRAGKEFVESAGQTVSPLTVYHGSPHKFEKFDPSKIGTGEGAQAYGHGLYFAESPGVARVYQNKLSDAKFVTQSGQDLRDTAYGGKLAPLLNEMARAGKEDKILEYLKNEAANRAERASVWPKGSKTKSMLAKEARDAEKLAKNIEDGKVSFHGGSLYTVDLPDEKIARMLDWDKPFEKQAESVQSAILKYWGDNPGLRHYGDPTKMTGEGIYGSIRAASLGPEGGARINLNPSNEAASMDLQYYGVPGIKYLDQGSRGSSGTGRWMLSFEDGTQKLYDFKPDDDVLKSMGATASPVGTRNFVVFPREEESLTILERKAEGGAVEMAGGGAMSKVAMEAIAKLKLLREEAAAKAAQQAQYAKEMEGVATRDMPTFDQWKAMQENKGYASGGEITADDLIIEERPL